MRFIRLLTLAAFLISTMAPAYAQDIVLTGRVQAQASKVAIPFVNIGIRGKNTGTTADENGNFSLRITARLAHDTLTFSAIGYREQAVAIAGMASRPQYAVGLVEKSTTLHEVVMVGRASKTRRIGTTTHNPVLWGRVVNNETYDIVEFVKLIPLADKPAGLLQAHIFLRYPTVDTVAFRLNFYGVAQGLPAGRLVEQSILVRTAIRNGWLSIDLTKYGLTLQTDFFLGFEFLPEKKLPVPAAGKKNPTPIFSYGGQFGGAAISRSSSLGAWKREPGASLSAYVTVRQ